MGLTPRDLIIRAQNAFEEGQENMGNTYMRAALNKLAAIRLERDLELPIFREAHAAAN